MPNDKLCRHKGDRGECLAPDCNCPPGTDTLPSDEQWTLSRIVGRNGRPRTGWHLNTPDEWPDHSLVEAVVVVPIAEVDRVRAEERAATLREVEEWKEKAEANVAIQLALSEKLNERDRAINDALRSLDNLKGHRCREQAAFLAHVDSIQQTLIAAAHFNPEAQHELR